jgi:pimeloyl-ACP methyl ester carboxylesterase
VRLTRDILRHALGVIPIELIAILLTILMLLSGCAGLKRGDVKAVAPVSGAPRAGNAYLLRGFIGVFSTGIDDIGGRINKTGVRANVYQDDQWTTLAATIRKRYASEPNHEPIVLIGHSYGADDVVRIARELSRDNITVDLLVTLDPVTPPTIPSNVKRCVNIYQSNGAWDTLPWLRGVPVVTPQGSSTVLANYNVRADRKDLYEAGVDHFNIEKKKKVQDEVIRHVLVTCPPREQWVMRNAPKRGQDALLLDGNAVIASERRTAPMLPASGATAGATAGARPLAVESRARN